MHTSFGKNRLEFVLGNQVPEHCFGCSLKRERERERERDEEVHIVTQTARFYQSKGETLGQQASEIQQGAHSNIDYRNKLNVCDRVQKRECDRAQSKTK